MTDTGSVPTQPEQPIPADDLDRKLTFADPNARGMRHISLVGDTYTILLSGEETAGRYALIDMGIRIVEQADQLRERELEQRVVGVVRMERAEIIAPDVERAVVVEQARAGPLREAAAEAEILAKAILLGAVGHGWPLS